MTVVAVAVDRLGEVEEVLLQFGLRQAEHLATTWLDHGFGPTETAAWLAAGVPADEPHIAAALAAAEWSPALAGRTVAAGETLTFVEAVRRHPNAALYARDLRLLAEYG